MEQKTILELQKLGLKVTPQRLALLRLLKESENHPSADELYHELLRKFPRISFATVYNTLTKLAEAGKIQQLDLDPRRKRFEPCKAPHHHFCCNVCGKIFDVVSDVTPLGGHDLSAPAKTKGHQVETIDVILRGVCRDCTEWDEKNKGHTEARDNDERG